MRRKQTKARKASSSSTWTLLGLTAGAVGWSNFASAAMEEKKLQTVLLPQHYAIQHDGTVVFQLETSERLQLTEDQYLILDGGLLLVVDEYAQRAMATLPVMGSLRTEILVQKALVRSPDGTVVEVSTTKPLWTGRGNPPRLFEEVSIERYELAQDDTQSNGGSIGVGGAASGGLGAFGAFGIASGISSFFGESEGMSEGDENQSSDNQASTSPPPASAPNNDPSFVSVGPSSPSTPQGADFSIQVSATDADSDPLNLSLVSAYVYYASVPTSSVAITNTGYGTWSLAFDISEMGLPSSAVQTTFNFEVSDGVGGTDQASYQIYLYDPAGSHAPSSSALITEPLSTLWRVDEVSGALKLGDAGYGWASEGSKDSESAPNWVPTNLDDWML